MTPGTRVVLHVTPTRRGRARRPREWVWEIIAEESPSGAQHEVGLVVADSEDAHRRARELVADAHPDLVVYAVSVDPTPDEVASWEVADRLKERKEQ